MICLHCLNFGTICKSWHSAAIKNNFNSDLPRVQRLMLPEEEEDDGSSSCRKFFSLYNGMILNKRIPKASGKRCMESLGWLITVGEDGEISLLHPFSSVQIELPHPNTTEDFYEEHETDPMMILYEKAVLSAGPSHTSDYVLMVLDGGLRFLSFWRPGDLRWTRISRDPSVLPAAHADVVYFNGYFYAIDFRSLIVVCDLAGIKTQIVAQSPFGPFDHRGQFYILESLGSLFVVLRDGIQLGPIKDDRDRIPLTRIHIEDIVEEDLTYGTTDFRVFQVGLAAGKVMETRELGDGFFSGC